MEKFFNFCHDAEYAKFLDDSMSVNTFSFLPLCVSGDITQKGYEKKRTRLLQQYASKQLGEHFFFFLFCSSFLLSFLTLPHVPIDSSLRQG